MKTAYLSHIGIATPFIAASVLVIASAAKQSSALVRLGSGLPRFARNDGGGRDDGRVSR
jgi:hypothetical protein